MSFVGQKLALEAQDDQRALGLTDELRAAVKLLRRRRGIILLGALLGALLCGIYALLATPLYRGVAEISIDPRRLDVLATRDERRKVEPVFDASRVDSQVEALRSDRMVRAVVADLKLVDDPAFNKERVSILGWLVNLVQEPGEPPSPQDRVDGVVASVSDSLSVARVENTFVVEIRYLAENAELAARVANGFAEAFIRDQLQANTELNGRAAGWLKTRLAQLATDAGKADAAVADFKRVNGIATSDGKSIDEAAMASIGTTLTQAATDTATAEAKLERILAINKTGAPEAMVSDALTNEVVIKLRQQYSENSQRTADLVSRVGQDHPAVQRLHSEKQNIIESLRGEMRRIEESYRSDYEIAKARQEAIRQNMGDQFKRTSAVGQLQVEVLQLESIARTARAAYEDAAQRYLQTVQNQTFPVTDTRVITQASPPTKKYSPKRMLLVALGALGGGVLGLMLGVAVDFGDRSLRTRSETSQALQRSCLGFVPATEAPSRWPAYLPHPGRALSRDPKQGMPLDHVIKAPFSVGTETMRSMRIAADQAFEGRSTRLLGIVSCMPGEGKTTIAANFAILLAQSGARVLLIDCDLRNPSLSRSLGPDAEIGLPDVVLGRAELAQAVMRIMPPHAIDFLPAVSGHVPRDTDLAASRAMPSFFERTRENYDYVIVDLPPLMPVVDVRALAESIDGFFLVIGWNDTSRDAVLESLSGAPVVWDRMIGSVLNKVRLPELARYGEDVRSYFDRRYMKD